MSERHQSVLNAYIGNKGFDVEIAMHVNDGRAKFQQVSLPHDPNSYMNLSTILIC